MTENMSHFILFAMRQDYVRAAYWLGKVENELPEDIRHPINQMIMGATYKGVDSKALNTLLKMIK